MFFLFAWCSQASTTNSMSKHQQHSTRTLQNRQKQSLFQSKNPFSPLLTILATPHKHYFLEEILYFLLTNLTFLFSKIIQKIIHSCLFHSCFTKNFLKTTYITGLHKPSKVHLFYIPTSLCMFCFFCASQVHFFDLFCKVQ